MPKSYKTLVISNSNLKLHEPSPETEIDADTDLIIFAGQTSFDNKRGLLYVEELAKQVPTATVIFNAGIHDCVKNGWPHQVINGYKIRISSASNCPDNIVYPGGNEVGDLDVFCVVGWPTVHSVDGPLEGTWIKEVQVGSGKLFIGDKLVNDRHPFCAEIEDVNYLARTEEESIQAWLNKDVGKQKVLVCGIHPERDVFMEGMNYTLFQNLNLKGVVVICAGVSRSEAPDTSRFKRLINNPGRNTKTYTVL